jgi:hypothetical protein
MAHNDALNLRLEHLGKIVPNVGHFVRRSVFAMDNPFTCALYGIIASLGVLLVWTHAAANDNEGQGPDSIMAFDLALALGLAGFVAGVFAMTKYRIRAQNKIHAREAAAYMDLNYHCHRTLDDEAWARFVALKTTPPGAGSFPAPVGSTSRAKSAATM